MKNIKILFLGVFLQTQIALGNPIKETATKTAKLTAHLISNYLTPQEELLQDIEKHFKEFSQAVKDEINQEEQDLEIFRTIQESFVDEIENFMINFRKKSEIKENISILKSELRQELYTPDRAYEEITKSFETLLTDPNDSKKLIDHINEMKTVASHLAPDGNEKHKEIIAIINFLDAHKDKNNLWNPMDLAFWAKAWNNGTILSKIPLPPASQDLSQNKLISIISKKL